MSAINDIFTDPRKRLGLKQSLDFEPVTLYLAYNVIVYTGTIPLKSFIGFVALGFKLKRIYLRVLPGENIFT